MLAILKIFDRGLNTGLAKVRLILEIIKNKKGRPTHTHTPHKHTLESRIINHQCFQQVTINLENYRFSDLLYHNPWVLTLRVPPGDLDVEPGFGVPSSITVDRGRRKATRNGSRVGTRLMQILWAK